jgi:hypothetical protein
VTDQELKEIRARLEAATPWHVIETGFSRRGDGPPTVYAADDELRYIAVCDDKWNITLTDNLANAKFIAHAREDMPRLLAHIQEQAQEIEWLRKENEELQKLVDKYSHANHRLRLALTNRK